MISIILPAYNEEGNLQQLYDRLSSAASRMHGYDFEFVFIDDCSNDKTADILNGLERSDERVAIIRFARNCGSHSAVAAGLRFCRGDAAIIMATDLQDPPEIIIPKMLEQWEKGYKAVWGERELRKGENIFTLLSSKLIYYLMNRLTDIRQPPTGADVVLLDRIVIDAYKLAPEKNTSILMLISWLGFSHTSFTYVKEARHAGHSKWSFSKRIKLALDSLISFSYIPLRFMSLMGIICALGGAIYGVNIFYKAFLHKYPVEGYASLMITILLIGGIQMIMLGFLGEYLWRTYDEARKRPMYVIEKNTLLNKTIGQGKTHPDEER